MNNNNNNNNSIAICNLQGVVNIVVSLLNHSVRWHSYKSQQISFIAGITMYCFQQPNMVMLYNATLYAPSQLQTYSCLVRIREVSLHPALHFDHKVGCSCVVTHLSKHGYYLRRRIRARFPRSHKASRGFSGTFRSAAPIRDGVHCLFTRCVLAHSWQRIIRSPNQPNLSKLTSTCRHIGPSLYVRGWTRRKLISLVAASVHATRRHGQCNYTVHRARGPHCWNYGLPQRPKPPDPTPPW